MNATVSRKKKLWDTLFQKHPMLPCSIPTFCLLTAVIGAGLSFLSAQTFAAVFTGALTGVVIALFVPVALLVWKEETPVKTVNNLKVLLHDAHLTHVERLGESTKVTVAFGKADVYDVTLDGGETHTTDFMVESPLSFVVRAAPDTTLWEAHKSQLPGSLTVCGLFTENEPEVLRVDQFHADFPLWSETYM